MTIAGDNDIVIPGDEAYLSFGGWAKPMANPPRMHERRRYIVDVECTDAAVKSSSKGERSVRSLSILRVAEVQGVVVPPSDDDESQGTLFDPSATTAEVDDSDEDEATPETGPVVDAEVVDDEPEAEADEAADVLGANVVSFKAAEQ